jgi:hypothetical protein
MKYRKDAKTVNKYFLCTLLTTLEWQCYKMCCHQMYNRENNNHYVLNDDDDDDDDDTPITMK